MAKSKARKASKKRATTSNAPVAKQVGLIGKKMGARSLGRDVPSKLTQGAKKHGRSLGA